MTKEEAIEYFEKKRERSLMLMEESKADIPINNKVRGVLTRKLEALDMAISALSEEDDTEWVDNGSDDFACHCKKCGQEIFKVQEWFKFCPNCGRKAVQK